MRMRHEGDVVRRLMADCRLARTWVPSPRRDQGPAAGHRQLVEDCVHLAGVASASRINEASPQRILRRSDPSRLQLLMGIGCLSLQVPLGFLCGLAALAAHHVPLAGAEGELAGSAVPCTPEDRRHHAQFDGINPRAGC